MIKNIWPRKLAKGATIGLVAPSLPLSVIRKKHIDRGLRNLSSMGISVRCDDCIGESRNNCAGLARERAKHLQSLFEDPEIDAVMTAIGGYNSNEILDYLDFEVIRSNPKIFVGYSDSTVISLALLERANLISFSGPSFTTFCSPEISDVTLRSFSALITGNMLPRFETDIDFQWADDDWYLTDSAKRVWRQGCGVQVFVHGEGEGILVGGNVDAMLSLAGTRYLPNLDGVILALEFSESQSANEILRDMIHLKQIGVFDRVAGVVVGRFHTKSAVDTVFGGVGNLLRLSLGSISVPVVYDMQFGHTEPIVTLPIGALCCLRTTNPYLTLRAA